jgi:hypothetical protein
MPQASDVQHFPMECPTCKTAAGRPTSIGTTIRSGALTVWMRCRYCNHDWRFAMPVTESKHDSGIRPAIKPPV